MRRDTVSAAVGKWNGILTSLGIDRKFLSKKHGPCPACGGVDRYRFDDKEGKGTWFCSKCGAGDGFALLRNVFGWDFKESCKRIEEVIGAVKAESIKYEKSDEEKKYELRKSWNEAVRVTKGDPVSLYLKQRTGMEIYPKNVRFHPKMRHKNGEYFPVMLSRMSYPEDDSGCSLHRTFLTLDGKKADVDPVKMFMPGLSLNTAAVRLFDACEMMGIAEGIETALCASQLFSIPTWAATNEILLQDWAPPAICKYVVIFGDNDKNFVGQNAAYALAKRLSHEGFTVDVRIPEIPGKDWCDVLHDKK